MLSGLGHDLVALSGIEGAQELRQPGVFFTEAEHEHVARATEPLVSLAGLFAAKEAFFKAVPQARGAYWTDIEVTHGAHGGPSFRLHGRLQQVAEQQGLRVHLSISHDGDYASAVVVAERAGAA
ncbi:MAG: holo-ACP synthase [Myxococcales bacterium]|nr:holo-ACP synthase [Myxococcales bacterium]